MFRTTVLCLAFGALAMPAPAQDAEFGGRLFSSFCSACHGEDAKGHGPVASMFKTAVPDLTKLEARHNGYFPYYLVYQTIDGRKIPPAHGTVKMPVFGNRYAEDRTDEMGQRIAHGRIFELIVYLQSLQTK